MNKYCEPGQHDWAEDYYGYKCIACGLFIPLGSEPWMPLKDEHYDEDGEPDYILDELEWAETYPELYDD